MTVKVLLQDIKKLETDALILGFFEDVRPLKHGAGQLDWLLCGSLSNLILTQKLRGAPGEVALLTSRNKVPVPKLFLAGLGRRDVLSPDSLQKAVYAAVSAAARAGVRRAVIEYMDVPGMTADAMANALKKGIADAARNSGIEVAVLAPDAEVYEKISRIMA